MFGSKKEEHKVQNIFLKVVINSILPLHSRRPTEIRETPEVQLGLLSERSVIEGVQKTQKKFIINKTRHETSPNDHHVFNKKKYFTEKT